MQVYKITNKYNGMIYIGQTIGTAANRWYGHVSDSKHRQHCRVLSRAIKKYGRENFSIEVLGNYLNLEDLNNAEIYFIELFNCLAPNGYNLDSGGRNQGHRNSDTCRAISEGLKGKMTGKLNPFWGKIHSPETKKLISSANKGKLPPNTGRLHSKETRAKIAAANLGRLSKCKGKFKVSSRSIATLCINSGIIYPTMREAARQTGCSHSGVKAVIAGRQKQTGNLQFKKVS
jgi:group I intron endonuclease